MLKAFRPLTSPLTSPLRPRSRYPFTISPVTIARKHIMNIHTVPSLKDPSLLALNKCYVNGEWVSSKSGDVFNVTDPATGKVIGTCADFSPEDTGNAIAAASAAFPAFKKTLARDRSRMLRRWHDLMMENADDIATLITWENGKPFSEALGEVKYAASYFEWFSEEAPRVTGDIIPASVPGNRIVTLKQPVGVCGILTPWNFPAAMITRKIGPALAAGCTVVAKTPAETPLTANALAVLAHRAGIPKGVVNIISGEKYIPEIGKTLTTHPDVRKISFTGSTAVGKLLVSQSSSTLKKLSLELGGNAPFIVFDDVPDLDAAVAGAIACKFRNSGQTCICANRIYVQKGIYSEFAKRFTAKVKELKLGGGFTQGVTNGPVIHSRSFDKVTSHVRDAIEKGATVELGGRAAPDLGPTFYEPTVLTGVHKGMKIASEETFGPVAGLFQFETEKEVIDLANRAEVGLAGYFFSKDVTRIFRIAENLEVGIVGVNTGGVSDAALPFGGVKQSGFGREGSKYGIDEYLTIKSLTFGGMDQPLQA